MAEIIFLSAIYLTGLLFGMLFVPKIPARFIQFSAFLWGMMIWVLLCIPVISIMGRSEMGVLFSLFGASMLGLGALHIKRKSWNRIPGFAAQLIFPTGIFAIIDSSFYWLHGIAGSPDSIYMVMISRIIATTGFFGHWTMGSPAWFGIDLPLLTIPAWGFHQEYLYSLQPLFLATLLVCFIYFGMRLNVSTGNKNLFGYIFPILGAAWLACTPLVFFQFFYIHDNIISAVFLFLSFVTGWSLILEEETEWLPFFMLSLTGFSLARVESPVFSLILLVIVLSSGKVNYRKRVLFILPYLVFISTWYLAISTMQIKVYMVTLTKTSLMGIVGVQVAFIVFTLLTGIKWVETRIIPYLHYYGSATVILVLGLLWFLNPELMFKNLHTIFQNLWTSGGWGYIWPLAILFLLVLANTNILFERIPLLMGSLYFIFVLFLGSLRVPSKTEPVDPYHVRWSDSANRMFTSLLPILIFYIVIKTREYIEGKMNRKQASDIPKDTHRISPSER